MKAVVENLDGKSFQVKEVQEPVLRQGSAIVKVLAAHIVPFTRDVLNGSLGYAHPEGEFTPGTGAIGVIEEVADDVFYLKKGDLVYCDSRLTSNISTKDNIYPDGILMGWIRLTENSNKLANIWKNGTFAEKVVMPQECFTKIDIDGIEPKDLAVLNYLTVAYGGLVKGKLKAGQTVVINGGTGGIGTAGAVLSLAMGASKVVAIGRDEEVLEEVRQLDPRRVVTVNSGQDSDVFEKELMEKAGRADMVLDVLGGLTTPDLTLAGLNILKENGTIVFVGGVRADIPVNYAKLMISGINVTGKFMYDRTAPSEILNMIRCGSVDLSHFKVNTFKLDDAAEAVEAARKLKGFNISVLEPNRK